MTSQKSTSHSEQSTYADGLRPQNEQNARIDNIQVQNEPHSQATNLKALWTSWAISVSKGVQPILKEIVVFAVYILGDIFILWLAGFAFADISKDFYVFSYIYDGLKMASVFVIAIHFLYNCVIEINKTRMSLPTEISGETDGKE